MSAMVWPFLIYWLAFFVACFTVCEVFQDWFYDEVTPWAGGKVAAGSLILAALATWARPSFDTIVTGDFGKTVLQAIVWVGVFILIYEFHPWHALAIGLITMVLTSCLATLGVDSLTKPRTLAPIQSRPNNIPLRKPLSAPNVTTEKTAPAAK